MPLTTWNFVELFAAAKTLENRCESERFTFEYFCSAASTTAREHARREPIAEPSDLRRVKYICSHIPRDFSITADLERWKNSGDLTAKGVSLTFAARAGATLRRCGHLAANRANLSISLRTTDEPGRLSGECNLRDDFALEKASV